MPKAGLFLFFAAAIVIVVLFALQPPAVRLVVTATPSASATPSATAPAARASASAAPPCASLVRGTFFADGSIDDRARAAQAYLESHPGQQAWVVITEAVLNAAAIREAQSQPVRDLRITIEPAGFRMSMTAIVIGTVTIELRELDTDGLPGFFRGTVEDSIRRAADPSSWGLRMRVDGIATDVGCAVVWGRA